MEEKDLNYIKVGRISKAVSDDLLTPAADDQRWRASHCE